MTLNLNSPALDLAWEERKKLRIKARQLWDKSNRLKEEASKIAKKGSSIRDKAAARTPWKAKGLIHKQKKLRHELSDLEKLSAKLRAEGDKINKEANKQWDEAIIRICGNIKVEWKRISNREGYECILENGLTFR